MNNDPINAKIRSTINNADMITKTPKNNMYQWNVFRKLTLRNNLFKLPDLQSRDNYNGVVLKQE